MLKPELQGVKQKRIFFVKVSVCLWQYTFYTRAGIRLWKCMMSQMCRLLWAPTMNLQSWQLCLEAQLLVYREHRILQSGHLWEQQCWWTEFEMCLPSLTFCFLPIWICWSRWCVNQTFTETPFWWNDTWRVGFFSYLVFCGRKAFHLNIVVGLNVINLYIRGLIKQIYL